MSVEGEKNTKIKIKEFKPHMILFFEYLFWCLFRFHFFFFFTLFIFLFVSFPDRINIKSVSDFVKEKFNFFMAFYFMKIFTLVKRSFDLFCIVYCLGCTWVLSASKPIQLTRMLTVPISMEMVKGRVEKILLWYLLISKMHKVKYIWILRHSIHSLG